MLAALLLGNVAVVWRLLPALGVQAQVLEDFAMCIMLLLVVVSILERELLNYLFGWYKPARPVAA